MISFDVNNLDMIENLLRTMPKKIPKVQAAAINRSLLAARTDIIKSVRKEYSISAADIRETLKINKSAAFRLKGEIISAGSVIPLVKFQKSIKGAAVAVQVKKDGGTKIIKDAFVQEKRAGGNGIFIRAEKTRYPIKQLYGPSIPQMIANKIIIESAENRAQEILNKRLEHEIDRILGGY